LIAQIASVFGVQAVVLSVDVIQDSSAASGFRIVTHGGRQKTDLDALEWIVKGVSLGAGEVCLNSINQDGTNLGFDLALLAAVRHAVQVPVIISGGAGTPQHISDAFDAGADAAIIASMLHYGTWTIGNIKKHLAKAGHPMRLGDITETQF
jgi:imidazole glycerol-phosphate synthase subunit HisF